MTPIPQEILDKGYSCPVHVEGWNPAARFLHVKTENGLHTIQTQKRPQRTFTTRNNLLFTRRNEPKQP